MNLGSQDTKKSEFHGAEEPVGKSGGKETKDAIERRRTNSGGRCRRSWRDCCRSSMAPQCSKECTTTCPNLTGMEALWSTSRTSGTAIGHTMEAFAG